MEVRFPHRAAWRPDVPDVQTDLAFMTVIVWALLFGTWFLPRDREVALLGLHKPLPRTFPGLLKAPFRSRW